MGDWSSNSNKIAGILHPGRPAAIVDGYRHPSHQRGVEERLTGAPSCATGKRQALVRGNPQGHLVFGFRLVVPGSATLQRGFRSRAGARRSQEIGTVSCQAGQLNDPAP